ncbi:hypothetical protein IJT10_00695 [bacterium]|nr:hypothetical protein [bacterium]
MSKKTFVFFIVFLLLILLAGKITAHPQHVRGSSNVAVGGYTNSRGNFILWSDGQISTLEGKILNSASEYDLAPGFVMTTRQKGKCVGAERVAVDSFVNPEATYVVFADGSVRIPQNDKARAGSLGSNFIYGTVEEGTYCSSGGFKRSGGWNLGLVAKEIRITFDKPFKSRPLVVLSEVGVDERRSSNMTGTGGAKTDTFDCRNYGAVEVTREGFVVRVTKNMLDSKGGLKNNILFLAMGE